MNSSAFFIGIKGVGMCALALAMQDRGWDVSGSDTSETFITDDILASRHLGVRPLGSDIPVDTDLIVYSAAYPAPVGANPGIRPSPVIMPLAQALAEFVSDKRVIAVAGVGGKTTTTAMLAAMFASAGRDVGYYVGTGSIAGLSAPGADGKDPYFVVEADEYAVSKTDKRPKFALLNPQILITTNIIHDHPDIYEGESATLAVFQDLVTKLPASGTWICNPTDPLTAKIIGSVDLKCKIITYGILNPLFETIKLSVFGDQNKLDGVAAVLAAIESGLPESKALVAIKAYRGAGRRQEYHGEIKGRLLYDDYGHHPREIELTVKSFKEHFPRTRVLLVFESHTYSRTEALLSEFSKAIATADLPFIMPIFESAREKGSKHTVTTESFAALIPRAIPLTWDNAAQTVWEHSKPGDLILTMGAGFVYKLHEQFKSI
jgi:UDP-N-acetylmuramate--alanine ligase